MAYFVQKYKWKKCVWTAPACTDRMSDLPETTLFQDFASHFVAFSQGTFFIHFLGAPAAEASKSVPKRVGEWALVGSFFRNVVPLWATGAQNEAPGP